MRTIAIVLAGGRAARFSGDKLAATVDGRPILHAALEAVAQLADAVIVAGPARGELDLPRLDRLQVVRDRDAYPGPLAAVAAALDAEAVAATAAEAAVVVGGDMPRLEPKVLAAMLARLAADPRVEAVLLGTPPGSKRQALPAVIRVHPARQAAAAALDSGQRALQSMLDRLAVAEVAEPEWRSLDPTGGSLVDVDRRQDLDSLGR